jgi:UDP-glucuronate decarboxylase
MEYYNKYNIDIKIVRIFNTYGPKMDENDGRVVSNFINQAINNQDITIYGNGDQTRSFCYIDDLIDGLMNLMQSDYHLPINIGNPNELNVKELAHIIIKLTTSKSKLIYKNLPSDDPTNRRPDIKKANQILQWYPKYDLEKGLVKTIHYFTLNKK